MGRENGKTRGRGKKGFKEGEDEEFRKGGGSIRIKERRCGRREEEGRSSGNGKRT